MRLTGALLRTFLERQHPVIYMSGLLDAPYWEGPLCYVPGEELKEGWAYILSWQERKSLGRAVPPALLIVTGFPDKDRFSPGALPESASVIVLGGAGSAAQIHNALVCGYAQHPVREEERCTAILRRIISDRSCDYMKASRSLTGHGWRMDHDYLCLVYQLAYPDQALLPASSICQYMEEQYEAASSFVFRSEIVTYFNLTLSGKTQEEIRSSLKLFIRDSYLKAGFSRIVRGHMDLRRQYEQAQIALDAGGRKHPYRWIHYFDQIAPVYIMEQITRKLPADMLIHPGIGRLLAFDKEHGTEYTKTLRCYLDHHLNAVQSARELFIHRSTFLYRLEKIREIIGSALTDPEELFYLSLSFRIMEHSGLALRSPSVGELPQGDRETETMAGEERQT